MTAKLPVSDAADARSGRRLLLAGFLAYLLVLLYSYRGASIAVAGDSADYLYNARLSLLSLAFFGHRPFTVPLIYKLLGANALAIVLFQVAFHAVCWTLLAVAVMGCMRGRMMRWVGFAAILLFSLSIEITLWNLSVLSESIAHSASAGLSGVVLLALRALPGRPAGHTPVKWLVLLVSATLLWSFTRDPNSYVVLAAGIALGLLTLLAARRRWPHRWLLGALAASCLLIFFLQSALLARSERKPWSYAVTTDICQRILPDPSARKFFLDAGMPDSSILMGFAGRGNAYEANQYSGSPDPSLIDPRYDAWVRDHGLSVYLRYVVSHPLTAAAWVWNAREPLLSPRVRSYGIAPCTLAYQVRDGHRSLVLPLCSKGMVSGEVTLTYELSRVFFPAGPLWALASVLLAVGCAALWVRRRRAALLVPLGLCAAALVSDLVTIIGDANEVDRHVIGAAILLRLALWLSLLFLADELLIRWRPGLATDSPPLLSEGECSRIWTGGLITGGYLLLLLYSFRESSISFAGDALDYIEISQDPLTRLRFWAYRPFLVPLLYRVFGSNPTAIVLFQVALHAGCWILLGWAMARWMRTRAAGWAAYAAVLGLSLSVEVNLWNVSILSESISISLTVAFLALVLLYLKAASGAEWTSSALRLQRWSWPLLLTGAAMAWSFGKDSNPYTLLLLAVGLILACLSPRVRRRLPRPVALLTAGLFIVTFLTQSWLLSRSTRWPWAYAVTTNICHRILPDSKALSYFREAGMPDSPILMQFSGKFTEYSGNKCAPAPDKSKIDPGYDAWVLHHGLQTYVRYIVSHPLQALGWVWADRHGIFSPSVRTYANIGPFTVVYQVVDRKKTLLPDLCSQGLIGGSTWLTSSIGGIFFPLWGSFYLLALLACMAPVVWFWGRWRPGEWVPPALLVVCVLNALVINLGDCSEVGRHSIAVAVLLRIAFWFALLLVGDDILARRGAGTGVIRGVVAARGER